MLQENHKVSNNSIAVAMSGGVDSSVTAALLTEKGFRVIGLTMRLWFDPEAEEISNQSCCSMDAVYDARKVANKLGIPHYVVNLKKDFKEKVVNYFVDEYLSGRTPNPCVVCNRSIKFGDFLDKARKIGADYLATGHYVRSAWDPHYGRYYLKKGIDPQKDQSYTLYVLSQEQLARSYFPLGEYRKEKVRQKAESLNLDVADKKESQEVCFIPDGNYRDFLRRWQGEFSPGPIKDTSGKKLGEHRGLPFYTVGQRRGLGLTSRVPLYVVKMNPQENSLVVGTKEEVYSERLLAYRLNFMKIPPPVEAVPVKARIRYRSVEVPAKLYPPDSNGKSKVELFEPQAAVTPGQSVVFYQEDDLLGGGVILSSL